MENEKEALSLKNLIVSASGFNDELGMPNASCVLYMDILHDGGTAPTPVHEIPMLNPTVNIFRHAETSLITLTFPSKFDAELRTAYNALENFSKAEQSMDDDGLNIPLLRLVVVPNDFAGKYYIVAANPLMWTLSPADATGEPRVIRFAVADENLNAYCTNEDEESDAESPEEESEDAAEIAVSDIEPESDTTEMTADNT